MTEHRFVWSGDDPDKLIEFTATAQDAAVIYRALNYQHVPKDCNFGYAEGPQFQGKAGSKEAMDSVRCLELTIA